MPDGTKLISGGFQAVGARIDTPQLFGAGVTPKVRAKASSLADWFSPRQFAIPRDRVLTVSSGGRYDVTDTTGAAPTT